MKTHYLSKPLRQFAIEADWLILEFEYASQALRNSEIDRTARLTSEMAIIRLHDAWARFSRELIILSAGGRAITASGQRLPLAPGITNPNNVISYLLPLLGRNVHFEPKWAVPLEAIKAAQMLNVANFSTISASLGATNSPAEEIRPLRNFLAHRGKDTAGKVRNHPSFHNQKPHVLHIAAAQVQGGTTRFENWALALKRVAHASIQ